MLGKNLHVYKKNTQITYFLGLTEKLLTGIEDNLFEDKKSGYIVMDELGNDSPKVTLSQ